MKSSPSKHVTTTSEVNTTILEWVQATEEFHCYHSKISAILRDRSCNRYADPMIASSVDKSGRVRSLNKLRQHMNHVLEILMTDMNNSSQGSQYTDNYGTSSQVGRLITHARLLKEINQKIGQELLLFSDYQA
jgi:hypothetical protein